MKNQDKLRDAIEVIVASNMHYTDLDVEQRCLIMIDQLLALFLKESKEREKSFAVDRADVKRFIAKTLKEHDEKLIEKMGRKPIKMRQIKPNSNEMYRKGYKQGWNQLRNKLLKFIRA